MGESWRGGGWGGPKEGHDKDTRFLMRGESRELPQHLYNQLPEYMFKSLNRCQTAPTSNLKMQAPSKTSAHEIASGFEYVRKTDSDGEGEKKKKKEKKKNKKDKQKKDKKDKKG